MSPKLKIASTVSLVATVLFTLSYGGQTSAAAQNLSTFDQTFAPIAALPTAAPASETIHTDVDWTNQTVKVDDVPSDVAKSKIPHEAAESGVSASSLASLVSTQARISDMPRELNCLAGAVYFEAKGESLQGQLAVARVVIDRSKSGRFPNSYCGVVYQPSQFSFVRGHSMPTINKSSAAWRNATAIAQIAHSGAWRSPVEGALFFHAARISPNWRLKRIARIDGHVFYK